MRTPLSTNPSTEDGSALAAVLVFVTVVSIAVGMVLVVHQTQQRLIHRDVDRVQAHYAAEAAVYQALADLDTDLHPDTRTETMEGGIRCSTHVEPFGGYARVSVTAVAPTDTVRLTALAGHQPSDLFEAVAVVGAPSSDLTVAGRTVLTGRVLSSEARVQSSTFRGTPFAGRLNVDLERRPAGLPAFDPAPFARALDRAASALRSPPTPSASAPTGPAESPGDAPVVQGRRVRYYRGSATLTRADTLRPHQPELVVATDGLTLTDGYQVRPGSIFIAGDTLRLAGRVSGRDGLFVGRTAALINGEVDVSGQLLARRLVHVGDRARLRYPSIAYVDAARGRVRITDRAQLDGLALHPRRSARSGIDPTVQVGASATVRGAIYNADRTEIQGTVHGTVLTREFGFYVSPTSYVNWLKDATLRRRPRPDPLALPYGLDARRQPTVIHWHDARRPVPPSSPRGSPASRSSPGAR